ncbi:hypothetical protein [Pseudomonas sp. 35 E 8]|uniref:hypothetical protein n=1 Tax=Pseudomonas sp. 35 E 8 TaxID=1844103 RepID=UPI00081BC75E|nr:hypothetical protein [Pseudomonas sp. 35 E 8]
MSIELTKIPEFAEKLNHFGIDQINSIALIPENIDTAKAIDDLRQQTEADTMRTILRINGISTSELFSHKNWPAYIQNNGFEWFGPTILIPASLIAQNPHITSIIIGLLTNYLYDMFKGTSAGTASLNIIHESPNGNYTKISYKGTTQGLSEIPEILRSLDQ